MNRDHLQTTCYALFASACVLTAALVVTASQKNVLPTANAEMVVNAGALQFLTAVTEQDTVESLFVLDSASGKLLIYKLDQGKKRIELVGLEDLKKRFGIAVGAGNADPAAPAGAGARAAR